MEKVKNVFLEAILLSLVIKCLITNTQIGDAILGVSLVISICYKESFFKKNQLDSKDAVFAKLEELEGKITDITSSMSSLKLDRAIKRGSTNDEKTIRRY